jgi:hypothetical protein
VTELRVAWTHLQGMQGGRGHTGTGGGQDSHMHVQAALGSAGSAKQVHIAALKHVDEQDSKVVRKEQRA